MIQVLGKRSPAKRQFIYTLAHLLAMHYGKYEIFSEHYAEDTEDYTDYLQVSPLKQYFGQENCLIESEKIAIRSEKVVYFLTPYYPEFKMLLEYIEREKPQEITIIYGDHIKESNVDYRYLERRIIEAAPHLKFRLLKIEWDKINKLISNEASFDGYYGVASLSKEYKEVLALFLKEEAQVSVKDLKRYFKWERRVRK